MLASEFSSSSKNSSSSRVSPCEKSEEKGQRQKVKLLCLNMKENKATGHKSKFAASLFYFGTFFGYIGSGPKNAYFLRIRFQKFI